MKEIKLDDLKKTYVIYFMDTDPDTGNISQMGPVAYTDLEGYAIQITGFLNKSDDSPGRTYKFTHL